MPGSTPSAAQSAEARFTRIVCAAAYLAGILLSLPLWSDDRLYPKAPLIDQLFIPHYISIGVLLLLVLSLLGLLLFSTYSRLFALLQLLGFSLLVVADQSRLQPWAYLYSVLLLLQIPKSTGVEHRALLCWIFAAVYFWSGLHKLNVSFIYQIFPLVMGNLMPVIPPELLPEAAITAVLFEAAAGLLLLVPCYQRVAAIFLILMHLVILVGLGPFGRSFNSVIWPWNIAMVLMLARIFVISDPTTPASNPGKVPLLYLPIWVLVVIMPACSFINRWDSYLSFALYSPNVVYGELQLDESEREKLPPQIQKLAMVRPESSTVALALNAWSYGELNAPAIPEPRVYRALARSLCRQYLGMKSLRLVMKSKPHWKTAEVTESTLTCLDLQK